MTIIRDINAAMDFSTIDSTCRLAFVDQAGKIISANPVFLSSFALPQDAINKTPSDLIDTINPTTTDFLRQTLAFRHEKAIKQTTVIDNKTLQVYVIEFNQAQRLIMVESSPSSPLSSLDVSHPAHTPSTASLVNHNILSE